MLAAFLTTLIQVIDLLLKREDHRKRVDQDLLARDLISFVVDLERIEANADDIRWYFFYIERDADSPARVAKHKTHLRQLIEKQIAALYALNDRYAMFRPMFEIYMEENVLSPAVAKWVFKTKQLYLYGLIHKLDQDNNDFPFTRSEYAANQLEAIHAAKRDIALIIRQNIPMVDFAKWYAAPAHDSSRNELDRARAMRLHD